LGETQTAAVGNGRNDRLMLKEAALGIVVVQTEGTAVEAMSAADLLVPGILEALDLLLFPRRLKATLRS
jgi:soluble P-type ATPase